MQFIDLKTQYNSLKASIDARIKTVLEHGKYISGPEVKELEVQLAEYVGVKHAITCANGTDALQLCMMALDIKQGDAVFCPTFTFFASAESIAFSQATPIFVDSDENTFNIDSDKLEEAIIKTLAEGRLIPKAIMSVDLFGLPADYIKLERLANKYNLKLIEDAAQGFGGSIDGKKAGSFGDIATTSFFPAKPLGCYGDGGAIFTNNDEYAALIRSLCVHGKGSDKYDNIRIGMNSRLDTIQAAVLLEKLAAFPQELIDRNRHAERYKKRLTEKVAIPYVPKGYTSSWAQFTLMSNNRDHLMDKLKKANIPSVVYYGTCMHQQTAFRELGYKKGDFPVAERMAQQVFSLPMHPYLLNQDIDKITDTL